MSFRAIDYLKTYTSDERYDVARDVHLRHLEEYGAAWSWFVGEYPSALAGTNSQYLDAVGDSFDAAGISALTDEEKKVVRFAAQLFYHLVGVERSWIDPVYLAALAPTEHRLNFGTEISPLYLNVGTEE